MNEYESTEKQKILVVDDEEYIRDLVGTALTFSGFDVALAGDGVTALNKINTYRPDLVMLDVTMPGMDGFEVVRKLRSHSDQTPVIFLTARDAEEDRISGFTQGGDDYVTKPFSLEELVARARAVLKRSSPAVVEEREILVYADLEIDEEGHRVTRNGRRTELSPTEFTLLRYLVINAETVLSKAQILDHVWQYDFGGDGGVVETYISYLRKKVDLPDLDPLIHTVRGFGYVLRSEP